jgi:TolB-like protein/Flp pilus assembly protein TadD
MAAERSFIVPVVVDSTRERDALVPDLFRDVQWTYLPGGEASQTFVARVTALLGAPAPFATTNRTGPALASTPPTQTRSRPAPWIALGLAALAIVVGGAWFALRYSGLHRHAQADTVGYSQPGVTEKSIAVLPFVDLSEKHDQDYFADGMAEEVIGLLARIPGLKVIGRTSSFQFKGKNQDLRDIGNTLGVSYVVEGSVRKSGERLRVTAQLISTRDSSHLWSDTYDAQLEDALDIQDRIASNLARALQVSMGAADYSFARPVFKSSEAYDLYLRGIRALDRNDKDGAESAVASFQRVLVLDPTSAGAAELLSLAQAVLVVVGYVDPIAGFERARVSAQRALSLDPKSSIAYQTLTMVHLYFDWDWAAAERDAKESLRLNARDPGAMGNLGDVYRALGRWDESAHQYETAISSDPLDPVWHSHLGAVWLATGRLREAEAEKRKVLQISPAYGGGHFLLGQVLLTQGRLEAALAEMQLESGEERGFGLAVVHYLMGRRAESDAALAKLIQEHGHDVAYSIAQVYGYRRELDQAFTWLDRAYRQKDSDLWSIKLNQVDPLLTNFAHDPRFAAFLRKMNLPE